MTQDLATYYIWIGGSSLIVYFIGAQASKLGTCDYGHKERAGGAAIVIEHGGSIISRDVISDINTTEFFLRCAMKASKGRAPYDAHADGEGDE